MKWVLAKAQDNRDHRCLQCTKKATNKRVKRNPVTSQMFYFSPAATQRSPAQLNYVNWTHITKARKRKWAFIVHRKVNSLSYRPGRSHPSLSSRLHTSLVKRSQYNLQKVTKKTLTTLDVLPLTGLKKATGVRLLTRTSRLHWSRARWIRCFIPSTHKCCLAEISDRDSVQHFSPAYLLFIILISLAASHRSGSR